MKNFLFLLAFAVCACAPTEEDRIGEAQLCLDKASPDEAMNCIEPIRDSAKKSAQIVKCSAGFASENFGRGERLIKAYRQLQDPKQGTPSFLGVMTFYTQRTPGDNRDFSRKVYGWCRRTEQPAYSLLGAMSLTATTISAVGGIHWDRNHPPDKEQIRRAMNALKATRYDPETVQAFQEIGEAVITMFINGCQKEIISNEKLCAQVEAAIHSSGDKGDESLGEKILDAWD